MINLVDAKQKLTGKMRDEVEREIGRMIDSHPFLSRLPQVDRDNAARAATTHLLLAIRAKSAAELL